MVEFSERIEHERERRLDNELEHRALKMDVRALENEVKAIKAGSPIGDGSSADNNTKNELALLKTTVYGLSHTQGKMMAAAQRDSGALDALTVVISRKRGTTMRAFHDGMGALIRQM